MTQEHSEAYLRHEYPLLVARLRDARNQTRNLKAIIRTNNEYIEILEMKARGETVTYAHGDPKSRLVPIGWYLGLKEENRMLRDALKDGSQ